jgi:hypothetical protein
MHNYTTIVLCPSAPLQTLLLDSTKFGFPKVHHISISAGVVRLEPYERSAYAKLLGARREPDGHDIDMKEVRGEWCDGCAQEEWKRMEKAMIKELVGMEGDNSVEASIE